MWPGRRAPASVRHNLCFLLSILSVCVGGGTVEGGEKEEEEKEGYWKQSKMIYFARHMAHIYTLGT